MQLERFREAKADEIRQLQKAWEAGLLAERGEIVRPEFFGALAWHQGLPAVIAEYKRASPSRGRICDSLSVEDVALAYARSGASALSILTEERYFDGQIGYLDRAARVLSERPLPILRKDFLFDPLQVYATAQTQASAILLIVRLTPDVRTLRTLRELAERLGLCAVVEVFDRQDLALARESGARIIQVNARDLERLSVDAKAPLALAGMYPPLASERWICASGIATCAQLKECAEVGFSACLVGTALMASGNPGQALTQLLGGDNRAH